MRQLYRAETDEYILVQADFKQLELWVNTAVTRDKVLEESLVSGDVYSEDAKSIFGAGLLTESRLRKELSVGPDNTDNWLQLVAIARNQGELSTLISSMKKCDCKTKKCTNPDYHVKVSSRHTSKTGHLAGQYACGLPKFHMQMLEADQTITWELSQLVFDGLHKRYARSFAFHKEEMRRVMLCGYSESRILFNRRSYPAPPELSEVANFPIQATAAEIAHLAMVMLDEILRKRFPWHPYMIIMQQHDAFVLEVQKRILAEVLVILKECMEQPHEIEGRVWTFPVDIKTGKRFSDT